MSQALRNRRNRRDNSQRLNEIMCGAVVSATAYDGEVRMIDVNVPVPSTAVFAGKMDDDLLPTE